MKILKLILCITIIISFGGCINPNKVGDEEIMDFKEAHTQIKDVFKVEDWQTIGSWRDILGECDENRGMNSNVSTEIYKLNGGGILEITISYASGGIVYPYIVLDNIIIVFFEDKTLSKNIMEKYGCSKCVYAEDITNSIIADD